MNENSLLTIIVPTYNRSVNLEVLLAELSSQARSLDGRVEVVVGDNCSSDNTPVVTKNFQAGFPDSRILRHEANLGPDENFCRCLDIVTTKYFWIVGDDDLPKCGVIAKLVELLEREAPDLVYMGSEWVNQVHSSRQGTRVANLGHEPRSKMEFARNVHVWFTFISGTIVNRHTLQTALQQQTIRRFSGTNLVQLGWIFPVLSAGQRFIQVNDRCVLATQDNTGGYALLTVFGANFPRIARQSFGAGSPIAELLISRTCALYLPQLIWASRGAHRQRFKEENPWPVIREQLGMKWSYWAVLLPIGKFPKPLAQAVSIGWRLVVRAARVFDQGMRRLS